MEKKKQWSPEEREAVFEDWATGKYGNMRQLADAYGINHEEQIFHWIKRYGWREKRGEYLEALFTADREKGKVVQEANDMHMQGWRTVIAHALNLLQPRKAKSGKLLPMDPDLLEKMSSVLRRAQQGQRLAIGADLSRNEDRSRRVKVVVGENGDKSDLTVLAKEVLKQHEKAHEEDKQPTQPDRDKSDVA